MHKTTSIMLRRKILINHKYFKEYKAMINTKYNHSFIFFKILVKNIKL